MPEILNIGENIRAFRRSLGITQEKLAEESGLSVNFISRLERTSDKNVSIKTLNKIAHAMQISTAQLVEDSQRDRETSLSVNQLIYQLKSMDPQQADKAAYAILQLIDAIKDTQ
ncbi:MAG: helix-turn-helix transcriptional regulator [Lactobacillus sp.]|nr:helix-turn-helix transcriptional regulator [Lactobacillus sp.]